MDFHLVLQAFCAVTQAQADELVSAASEGLVEKVGGEGGGGRGVLRMGGILGAHILPRSIVEQKRF